VTLLSSAALRHTSAVQTGTVLPSWLDDRFRSARASALLWLDASGRPSFSQGPAEEVEALRGVISRTPRAGASGVIWAGRLLFVSAQPVDVQARGGYIALARPVDQAVSAKFTPLTTGLTVSFRPPSAVLPVSFTGPYGGFQRVGLKVAGGQAVASVEIPGLAGPAAAVAQLDLKDGRITDAMAAGGRAATGTAGLVGILAAAFGLLLGAALSAPIDRTRRHLRDEAPLALEGLPTRPMPSPAAAAVEFQELASDVDGLLAALTRRQSELVEATAQARAAEEVLRAALDGSAEGNLLVEGDCIVVGNPAAERILGVPLSQLVGMRAEDILGGVESFAEDGHRLTPEEAEAITAKEPLVARLDCQPERWVEVTRTDLSADPLRVLISIRDITDERHLDEMREGIFSIVSHDLRAPLTVVQGYLDILERPLQPEARRRALESARHNATKMAGLLEDLLDATAADRLLAPKVLQPVDVLDLAQEVASSMRETAIGHTIVVTAEEERVVVSGEERRLRQALLNLVTNAVKYAPEDTTITVGIGKTGDRVLLSVEDEGPGIPAEARETVFERYGRLASTAEGKPGFGLGLYIVRIIAEKHGGRALVEEAPGGGARFVIELPASAGAD
jgi:signal transduction histidine kinase